MWGAPTFLRNLLRKKKVSMSLVLALNQKKFAAVACDGRVSIRRADGGLVAVGEDRYKFRVLAPDIVLAATGSSYVDERLYVAAEDFVQQRIGDENLFAALVEFLPRQLLDLHALAAKCLGTSYEGTVVELLGFDARERRIRRVFWQACAEKFNYGDDHEQMSCLGNEDATPLALDLMVRFLGPNPPLEKVLPTLKFIIERVAEALPHSVNSNVRSYLIVPGGGALLDGTSRFAATGAGLSYRPLSNPLTATDAGASATVSVAAFTQRVAGKGDISVSSGSVTALSYSTLYYVYYDDANLAGGGVTFSATTTKENALNAGGRFFVGSITTPAAGASNTIGNNDGGTGVQSGVIANTYPTSFGGTFDTSSSIGGNGLSTPGTPETETWSGIIPTTNDNAAYSKVLSVSSSVTFTSATGTATLKYSLNGGSSFTTIYTANGNRAATTDTVTLPAGQDLTQVQVQASVNCSTGTRIQQNVSLIKITETS